MEIVSSVRFRKIREIGSGQGLNSTVWLAWDHQLACELAVKEIDKGTFWNPNYFAEAQAVQSIDHPNVVSVKYGSEEGNSAFIAMPYYQNGSLADRIAGQPLGLSSVLSLAQGVLLGLGHIHMKGYVHLDLKPSNIFFDSLSRPLVADFGQSRRVDPSGVVSVPPLYQNSMPPEALVSGKVSYVSDLYQVGVLLYRAVNGEDCYASQLLKFPDDLQIETAIKKGKLPDRQTFLPHVPKALRTALRKAMNVKPADRFGSANDFAGQLGRIWICNDWVVNGSDEIEWKCSPDGRASLVVDLRRDGTSWRTCVHTENDAGIRRAKSQSLFWGKFSSRAEALMDLKRVFESL